MTESNNHMVNINTKRVREALRHTLSPRPEDEVYCIVYVISQSNKKEMWCFIIDRKEKKN